MDWDKKVYPKDLWNWIKKFIEPLLPEIKFSDVKTLLTEKKKFKRTTTFDPFHRTRKVRTFVNGEERVFDAREQQYFDTAMNSLDDAMSRLDRMIDEVDMFDTGVKPSRPWPKE